MTNIINPASGTLLPTQQRVTVNFKYDGAGGSKSIEVTWHCDDDSNVRFLKDLTGTDDGGNTSNQISYEGPEPAVPPTITIRRQSDSAVLLQVKYNFKFVQFEKDSISYPQGVQGIFPFGRTPDPLRNGVQVAVRAIDPSGQAGSNGLDNFHVVFSSDNNVLSFYKTDGTPITGLSAEGSSILRYPTTTGSDGYATLIALTNTAGIFHLNAGYASDGESAEGRIVLLNDVAPDQSVLKDPPTFPTADDGTSTINLDETPGPTFPVKGPSSMLESEQGPLQPMDPVVLVTYAQQDGPSTGVVSGSIVTANTLVVDGVNVAKAKISSSGKTGFYWMGSNGVGWWQSATSFMTAEGQIVTGPDQTVTRIKYAPYLEGNPSVINREVIEGNLIMNETGVVHAALGAERGDTINFNIYLSGWVGNSKVPRADFYNIQWKIVTNSGAKQEVLKEEWLAGYGHNGSQTGWAIFEIVNVPGNGDPPRYSALLKLPMDTMG
jgi:hypothetical protein